MIRITFFNDCTYSFELKNKDREMNLCIDIAQCNSANAPRTFKITNRFGIVRFIRSNEIKLCEYKKETLTNERKKEEATV